MKKILALVIVLALLIPCGALAADPNGTAKITLSYGDTEYVTVPLLAMSDVAASRFLIMKTALINFFSNRLVQVLLILLVVVLILLWFFGRRIMQRRRYGAKRNKRRRHRAYRGRRF